MSLRTLPSRPTPRSRSVGRNTDETEYGQAPPLPSSPRIPSSRNLHSPNRTQRRMDEGRTVSSTSSSTSSFLDRMKFRGEDTSMDDGYAGQRRRNDGVTRGRGGEAMKTEQYDDNNSYQDSDSAKQLAGYGSDLWGRVTAVAGNLTVNVSKAWEKGIATVDGEDTPPGQESRLTKAMKAYHLSRARSPTDLPAWLFDESERRAAPRSWSAPKKQEYEDEFLPEQFENRQKSSLRDIYDKAAASSSSNSQREPERSVSTSGAANRLKLMREAKRSAARTQGSAVGVAEDRQPSSSEATRARSPPARVGLPSGPGRSRRV